MRLIDADATKNFINCCCSPGGKIGQAVNLVYEWAKDVIDGMPTVTNMDVLDSNIKAESRQTGHWIKISPANIYECSECHKGVCTADIECYEFCHQCGADMRGKEE